MQAQCSVVRVSGAYPRVLNADGLAAAGRERVGELCPAAAGGGPGDDGCIVRRKVFTAPVCSCRRQHHTSNDKHDGPAAAEQEDAACDLARQWRVRDPGARASAAGSSKARPRASWDAAARCASHARSAAHHTRVTHNARSALGTRNGEPGCASQPPAPAHLACAFAEALKQASHAVHGWRYSKRLAWPWAAWPPLRMVGARRCCNIEVPALNVRRTWLMSVATNASIGSP
jgi:hypothetical protein